MAHTFGVTPGTGAVLAGRYRLDSRIAAGGVGEVWRAVDLVLGRPVAVKLLRAEYAEHPETLARFRAEARHAGSLSHPGIAQVYDYGEARPPYPPYLVMELVDGPSLAVVLTGGPLGPAPAMDVVGQAAGALALAHAAGLVHRDIKPGNLLLGRGGEVKITDFGIAHAAGSAPITRAGTLVGTPAYLAPERAAGAVATPASDLYSLGVVAYECLAGVAPFTGEPLEVAAAHRQHELPPLPPVVPAPVAALVAELTAKDPAARPGSAGEVAARAGELRHALAGRATLPLTPAPRAGPVPGVDDQPVTLAGLPVAGPLPWYRSWRRDTAWPRRPAVLAVATAIVLAGLAGWLLAGVLTAPPPAQGPAAPPSAVTAPGTPAAGMVEVNASALVRQPAAAVRRQLRELGLRPRVILAPSRQQAPGTVVSVQPSGQVPAGSTIDVTVAARQHGNGHGDNGGD